MVIWAHPQSFQLPKTFSKILYLSLHLSKDLWGCFLHTIFLLNHSFQVFLPDFLQLKSFSPLSTSYSLEIFWKHNIPVFLQEVVGPRFTWTSSNHVLCHVSQTAGKNGWSSTRWHGLSFFLKPQKPLGTAFWDQGLGGEIETIHPGSLWGSKPRRPLLLLIFLFTFASILCVCTAQEQTMVKHSWKNSSIISPPTWVRKMGQAAGKRQVAPAWLFLASQKCLWV